MRRAKFKDGFGKYASPGDSITCTQDKWTYTARIEHDEDMGAPWKEHDGHGPVSEWVSRPKAAGERVLSRDRESFRFYDFAEAVKIAKRDGWGPGTPAEAAEKDFEAMKGWANDEWTWCGVVVSVAYDGVMLDKHAASLWGIDLNHPSGDNSYLLEVANELLDEARDVGAKIRLKLCTC